MSKILIYDIETSPNLGMFWRPGNKVSIGHDNIVEERKVITIAYKWHGKKRVYGLTWDSEKDDKAMLEEFAKVLEEADAAIAHNGDAFDIKWLRGRCLKHGIPFSPFTKTVDTYKISRGLFNLNSHKLDYLHNFLGGKGKISTGGFSLWKNIMLHNKPKDLKKMLDYNKNDVVILEEVFEMLKPYMKPFMHASLLEGGEAWHCPHCGSDELHHYRARTTATGSIRWQRQCEGCGAYSTISNQIYNKLP